MVDDMIVAFATPVGTSGLQVLRVAGPGSAMLTDRIFSFGALPEVDADEVDASSSKRDKRTVAELPGYQAAFGYVHQIDKPHEAIDQCILTKFVKGKSYTGEEQVELSIHGGNALRKILLNLFLDMGVRIAEPGEFTKWAFINGKLDLSQAEAVMDLIEADTSRQHEASIRHLQGQTGNVLDAVKDKLYELLSSMEVDIEYPEYEDFNLQASLVDGNLTYVIEELEKVSKNNRQGEVLREGLQLVLVGEPNVGKSSLLNSLSGQDRAIVTNIAGTTRDSIELRVELDGIPLTLHDTAGIRETDDPIEKLGVERSVQLINNADLLLFVINAVSEEQLEREIEQFIRLSATDKDFILVFNKLDLTPKMPEVFANSAYREKIAKNPHFIDSIWVSALDKTGIDDLKSMIVTYYENLSGSGASDLILTSARQQHLLEEALAIFKQLFADKDMLPNDIVSSAVRQGLEILAEITGEDVSENMLNDIFSRFCIGK